MPAEMPSNTKDKPPWPATCCDVCSEVANVEGSAEAVKLLAPAWTPPTRGVGATTPDKKSGPAGAEKIKRALIVPAPNAKSLLRDPRFVVMGMAALEN